MILHVHTHVYTCCIYIWRERAIQQIRVRYSSQVMYINWFILHRQNMAGILVQCSSSGWSVDPGVLNIHNITRMLTSH